MIGLFGSSLEADKDITAWKICVGESRENYRIVQMRVPKGARRVKGKNKGMPYNKYRADEVKVENIFGCEVSFSKSFEKFSNSRKLVTKEVDSLEIDYSKTYEVAYSIFSKTIPEVENTEYRVGERIKLDDFDADRDNQCAEGIHYFTTIDELKQFAKNELNITKSRPIFIPCKKRKNLSNYNMIPKKIYNKDTKGIFKNKCKNNLPRNKYL